jgi:hypothetical protein
MASEAKQSISPRAKTWIALSLTLLAMTWRERFTTFVTPYAGMVEKVPRPYSIVTRERHRDSKLLSSSSIRACASMGSLRFSVTMLTGGAAAFACAGAAAGHRNNDFDIWALPAYQHFRPSIRRQDQCPFDDGAAMHSLTCALTCALACAAGMPIGMSAEMQTAKTKSLICKFIGQSPAVGSAGRTFFSNSGHKRSEIWLYFTGLAPKPPSGGALLADRFQLPCPE